MRLEPQVVVSSLLIGGCPMATTLTPDVVPDFSHCEFYSSVEARAIHLCGEWMAQAGFVNGMPVKIRVMKDCIVITPQNTRELWGCLEGMSASYINRRKVKTWLQTFPGSLNDTGDIPLIKRRKRF
ncbi:type I toxin-antitoxin system SymE family toxin [Klebsiella michiganensis]|nr:type I toxin-antitoxin system SymE family toxin [Klebsiella michiganensis]ELT9751295.1 type I toxin-antitoxin system SymE family toxin [Klebsiella michiganensis]MBF8471939.1 type I toxin-antitoxin system SymE family toxin [Klebsiella michiganensis]MBZ6602144.1 type I toxin-antitoxin system SymE family toxin [Klebsiella michiganensis]MBZ7459301.1 type I toxin-antitoxin system SymE family toxin [Klebsiella michiganensis]